MLLAFALLGCGSYRAPTVRAMAVTVGAFGTGAATSAQSCMVETWDACRQVALTGLVVSAALSLAAGSVAFLEADDERQEREQRERGERLAEKPGEPQAGMPVPASAPAP